MTDFEDDVQDEAKQSVWAALRRRVNNEVARLGLSGGALPDRDGDE